MMTALAYRILGWVLALALVAALSPLSTARLLLAALITAAIGVVAYLAGHKDGREEAQR